MEDISYYARMQIQNPQMIQLYSAATPNGMKVSAMLEEIVDLRATTDAFQYEPHTIDLRSNESRSHHFKQLSLNGKIPVIVDPNGKKLSILICNLFSWNFYVGPGGNSITIFESGNLCLLKLLQ